MDTLANESEAIIKGNDSAINPSKPLPYALCIINCPFNFICITKLTSDLNCLIIVFDKSINCRIRVLGGWLVQDMSHKAPVT